VDGFSEKGGEGENDSVLFTNIDKLSVMWNCEIIIMMLNFIIVVFFLIIFNIFN
jgi:hypothetical protein